jgi:hypothetical protein
MPDPSMPCRQATPKTPVFGVARPQGGQPADVFFSFGNPTLYAYGHKDTTSFMLLFRVGLSMKATIYLVYKSVIDMIS